MTDSRPPGTAKDVAGAGGRGSSQSLTGKDVAGAGALMLSVNLLCAGIGAGLGAAVGAVVPLFLVGFGIGFFAGIYVVVKRFSAL